MKANGMGIFFREGEVGHPLILLHRAADTHRLWDPVLADLSRHFRVITLDSRGRGRTISAESLLTYRTMGDDLAGLIPGAEQALIPGAGQNDVLVQEGQFLEAVLDFLERIEV